MKLRNIHKLVMRNAMGDRLTLVRNARGKKFDCTWNAPPFGKARQCWYDESEVRRMLDCPQHFHPLMAVTFNGMPLYFDASFLMEDLIQQIPTEDLAQRIPTEDPIEELRKVRREREALDEKLATLESEVRSLMKERDLLREHFTFICNKLASDK